MKEEFNTWWHSGELLKDNPYRPDSPAYWAWEGWCAAVKAERDACAKVAEKFGYDYHQGVITDQIAAAIRERGQDPMPLFDDWGKDWK